MSSFNEIIKKMKKKKELQDDNRKKELRPIYDTLSLMKKAAKVLKEKKEKQKKEHAKFVLEGDRGVTKIEVNAHVGEGEKIKRKYDKPITMDMKKVISQPKPNSHSFKNKSKVFVTPEEEEKKKENIKYINETYPLKQRKFEDVLSVNSFCNIKFKTNLNCLVYDVIEPPLTPEDKKEIKKINNYFEETISIHFEGLRTVSAIDFVKKTLLTCIKKFGLNLTDEKQEIYKYYLFRDLIGLERIEPLMNDPNIEDISCDGVNIPVFIFHRNPKYGSMQTNIIFSTKKELDNFTMKLAQRCGKTVSVANPYFDGALSDGSRVQSTLATDIATHGSNFTIRKFLKDPITPIFLLKYKTIDVYTLAYLWFLIEYNTSVLVVGGTASGKTSLLNALSLFIRPNQKIISIEDTAELQLSHDHWIAEVSREGFETIAGHEKKVGEVSMLDLLKEALRQRPDYIIVGEVRGEEAIILFQAMATGHSGLATIHADSMERLIDRITSKPMDIPVALLETLDLIVFIKRLRYRDSFVRRISHIYEIDGYDKTNNNIISREVFRWNAIEDQIVPKEESVLLGNLYTQKGISQETIKDEIKKRAKILNYMDKKNITYYKDVAQIINKYYTNPDALIEQINSINEKERVY
ncbi:MAG: type IV secretion system protein VirB11 [Candidatus Nanohalarchaeota archaeon]|nr:MAG: type IV secretion system protein VirB11 [Candidatus Nanohaloarchaeota archaeon]